MFKALFDAHGGDYGAELFKAITDEKTPIMTSYKRFERRLGSAVGRDWLVEFGGEIANYASECAEKGYERGFVSGVRFMVECMTR